MGRRELWGCSRPAGSFLPDTVLRLPSEVLVLSSLLVLSKDGFEPLSRPSARLFLVLRPRRRPGCCETIGRYLREGCSSELRLLFTTLNLHCASERILEKRCRRPCSPALLPEQFGPSGGCVFWGKMRLLRASSCSWRSPRKAPNARSLARNPVTPLVMCLRSKKLFPRGPGSLDSFRQSGTG